MSDANVPVILAEREGRRLAATSPGQSVEYLRFRDLSEVDARADELHAITRAWCAYKDRESKR